MQVNPDNQTFDDIKDLKTLSEEELNRMQEEQILVTGQREKLEKLQTDLEKAGYTKKK